MRIAATGIPWYRKEEYGTLRKLFVDGEKLPALFRDWERAALDLEERIRQSGMTVVRAPLSPNEFPQWCRDQGLSLDSQARSRYASEYAKSSVTPNP